MMKNTKEREAQSFYHVCAYGHDSKNFIVSQRDWYAAFNLVGVCIAKHLTVKVMAFTIEDSHPHFLLFGSYGDCKAFIDDYQSEYYHHLSSTRGSYDGVVLRFELLPVNDEKYLMNVAAYVLVQPTKDGKKIMPHDYLWGTGSMYFRSELHIDIWRIREGGIVEAPRMVRDLTSREKREILFSRTYCVPDNWLVCNGFLMPTNYVDVKLFESIFKTHNAFRFFTSISGKALQEVETSIAHYLGVAIEDFEARKICIECSRKMFGNGDARRLNSEQRLRLAMSLRKEHRLSFRQLSALVHLPESELKHYIN